MFSVAGSAAVIVRYAGITGDADACSGRVWSSGLYASEVAGSEHSLDGMDHLQSETERTMSELKARNSPFAYRR